MNLKNIISGIEGLKAKGNLDIEVNEISTDSRNIKPGDMFIAIKGFDTDGHKYIPMAIQNGAKVVLIDESELKNVMQDIPQDVVLITSPDSRIATALCACNFYDNPSRKMQVIGITGTKGKTTTTFMIKSILEKQGIKTGLIGTIAAYSGSRKIEDSDRTTPDSIKLQSLFAEMVKDGCTACVMEVSSQSLKLHRVDGTDFNIGIFTNFSEDHISPKEHPNMEDYFNSKVKLFQMCKYGFINVDDINTIRVPKLAPNCIFRTYGIDNESDILAKDITITNSYVDFRVKVNGKNERIKTDIPGRFSVYNSLAAISVAEKLGCSTENIKQALETVKVPGRSELVDNKLGLTIMIDYAHSPESLENILQAVKSYTRGRVISVFGCGGDRDTTKRPLMGAIAQRLSDICIVTSDNPRTEDPELIIEDILKGLDENKENYKVVIDRREAIKEAIEMAQKDDIVIIAGKGHENYQILGKVKHHFDDKEIAQEFLSNK